jgi:hypothetical protein
MNSEYGRICGEGGGLDGLWAVKTLCQVKWLFSVVLDEEMIIYMTN